MYETFRTFRCTIYLYKEKNDYIKYGMFKAELTNCGKNKLRIPAV
jgi:hypothetical protein